MSCNIFRSVILLRILLESTPLWLLLYFLLYPGYLQLRVRGTHSLLSIGLHDDSLVPFFSCHPSLLQNGLVGFVAILIIEYIPFTVDSSQMLVSPLFLFLTVNTLFPSLAQIPLLTLSYGPMAF